MKDKMNKIHNIDCLEFMKQVPDNYFDLVLTDPPYGLGMRTVKSGINAKNSQKKFMYDLNKKQWDNKTPSDEVFNEIFRISKNQIICGGNYFNLPPTRCFVMWDKNKYMYSMSDCEYIWTSFDKPSKIYKKQNVIIGKKHPTQKPIELIEYLLNSFANKGIEIYSSDEKIKEKKYVSKVFDPFIGSGTTAVACKSLGLDWCGCELESDYVGIANKRLEAVQGSLF